MAGIDKKTVSVIRKMIRERGRTACDNPDICKALLRDYLPHAEMEIHLLVEALRLDTIKQLGRSSRNVPVSATIETLAKRLQDARGFSPPLSRWAVATWAYVLDYISQPEFEKYTAAPTVKPQPKPKPQVQPQSNRQPTQSSRSVSSSPHPRRRIRSRVVVALIIVVLATSIVYRPNIYAWRDSIKSAIESIKLKQDSPSPKPNPKPGIRENINVPPPDKGPDPATSETKIVPTETIVPYNNQNTEGNTPNTDHVIPTQSEPKTIPDGLKNDIYNIEKKTTTPEPPLIVQRDTIAENGGTGTVKTEKPENKPPSCIHVVFPFSPRGFPSFAIFEVTDASGNVIAKGNPKSRDLCLPPGDYGYIFKFENNEIIEERKMGFIVQ